MNRDALLALAKLRNAGAGWSDDYLKYFHTIRAALAEQGGAA